MAKSMEDMRQTIGTMQKNQGKEKVNNEGDKLKHYFSDFLSNQESWEKVQAKYLENHKNQKSGDLQQFLFEQAVILS